MATRGATWAILLGLILAAPAARADVSGRFTYAFEAPELGGLPVNGTKITLALDGQTESFTYQIGAGPHGPTGSSDYRTEGPISVREGLEVTVEYLRNHLKYKYKTVYFGRGPKGGGHLLDIRLVYAQGRWQLALETPAPRPEPEAAVSPE